MAETPSDPDRDSYPRGGTLIDGLGGPAGFGESFLAANDDGSSALVDVSAVFEDGFSFFGARHDGFYVNNNGNVTFGQPLATYTPFGITAGSLPGFFPYFADVDTRAGPGGTSPGGASAGSGLVWWHVDPAADRVVVTWDDVGYYNAHGDRLAAFQLVLRDASGDAGREAGDFDIMFRYEHVNWSAGDASGGAGGLGGTPARAGWTAGDGAAFFELPQSGEQDGMLGLESAPGNTGVPGLWLWEVSGGEIPVSLVADGPGAVIEGDDGTTPLDFAIRRFGDRSETLEVDWELSGDAGSGRAAGGRDVEGPLPRSGTLRLEAGAAEAAIPVLLRGDAEVEADEVLALRITGVRNLTNDDPVALAAPIARAVILNDDGLPPPPPAGRAADLWGGGRLTTFDGLSYALPAAGDVILAEDVDGPLRVHVRLEARGDAAAAVVQAAFDLGGTRLTLDAGRAAPLWIDGAPVALREGDAPLSLSGGRLHLNDGEWRLVMETGEQAALRLHDGALALSLHLNPDRAPGSLRGLLGDGDGNIGDDLARPDGGLAGTADAPPALVALSGDFARAWAAEGLLDGPGPAPDPLPLGLTLADLPEALRAWALDAAAAAGIADATLREAAALDYALSGGDPAMLEAAAEAVAAPVAALVPTARGAEAPTLYAARLEADPSEGDAGFAEIRFRILRGGDASAAVTGTWSAGGAALDEVAAADRAGVFALAPGQLATEVALRVAADEIAELDESLSLTIASDDARVAAPRREIALLDDDGPVGAVYRVEAERAALREGGEGERAELAFTVLRGGDAFAPGAVGWTLETGEGLAGADDLAGGVAAGRLDFAAGQGAARLVLRLQGDAEIEGDERLVLRLTAPEGGVLDPGAAAAETRIIDDDAATAGDDVLGGGVGDDRLHGLDGNDSLFGGRGDDVMRGGGGRDLLRGQAGEDRLLGGAGGDRLKGGGGEDALRGGAGRDRLNAGRDDDRLFGGADDDRLAGKRGADVIVGQKGDDRLIGGAGLDLFVFRKGDGRDRILDFQNGRDAILFRSGAEDFNDLEIEVRGDDVQVAYRGGVFKIMDIDAELIGPADFLFG